MGRKIRKVPPNWDHPISKDEYGRERRQPMYDECFTRAFAEWLDTFDRMRRDGPEGDERKWYPLGLPDWLKDNSAPDPEYYRPWQEDEATWVQVWETVSEGTPVTPPFATEDELVAYLAENGDEWDQKRCLEPDHKSLWGFEYGKSGWGRTAAERFVKAKWAPSLVDGNGIVADGKLVA